MALRNRQDGKVEIFVGIQKVEGIAKNVIEFDELALAANVTTAIAAASTKANLLTTLGVVTYADNEAALAASVPVGTVYYSDEVSKLMVVLAGV